MIRETAAARGRRSRPASPPTPRRGSPPAGQRNLTGALAAVLVVVLATGAALVVDPSSPLRRSGGEAVAVAPTGNTTSVEVTAVGMRFVPDSVVVPAGDRLEITFTNTDETTVHDLYLTNGADSGRVEPGETAAFDAGVIATARGWCTIAGHKAWA